MDLNFIFRICICYCKEHLIIYIYVNLRYRNVLNIIIIIIIIIIINSCREKTALKKLVQVEPWEKIEQVLSTAIIIIIIFEILRAQKNHAFHTPENYPAHP